MSKRRLKTWFPVSLHATPSPVCRRIFYTVLRAGHVCGGRDHHIRRESFTGHELIYCLRGAGEVRVGGRMRTVGRGDFVWIDCARPHEYRALEEDPWELYWVRMEGPCLGEMCEILSVHDTPVFGGITRRRIEPVYREVFRLLRGDALAGPALVHAQAAGLVALAFGARQFSLKEETGVAPRGLWRVLEHLRASYAQPQRVVDLAAMSGMSASHFSRSFKAAFGTSPIDWVRRERINHAKQMLAGAGQLVKEVAERVGYPDRFYFSKDFKQLTGMTPREFRLREEVAQGRGAPGAREGSSIPWVRGRPPRSRRR